MIDNIVQILTQCMENIIIKREYNVKRNLKMEITTRANGK